MFFPNPLLRLTKLFNLTVKLDIVITFAKTCKAPCNSSPSKFSATPLSKVSLSGTIPFTIFPLSSFSISLFIVSPIEEIYHHYYQFVYIYLV